MYEVDHKRCFIITSGGAIKADNAVKREYSKLGYHGQEYTDVPQRHAGFCKMKLGGAEEAIGAHRTYYTGPGGAGREDMETEVAKTAAVMKAGSPSRSKRPTSQGAPPTKRRASAYAGEELAFAHEASITSTDVMTYGFAAVGVSFLMFGAFRYYSGKSDYVELEMA